MFNQMHVGAFADDVLIEDAEAERNGVRRYNEVCMERCIISDWDKVSEQSKKYYRSL